MVRGKLGYTCKEDWYEISAKNFRITMVLLCLIDNGSPIEPLKALITDYEWLWWKFIMHLMDLGMILKIKKNIWNGWEKLVILVWKIGIIFHKKI